MSATEETVVISTTLEDPHDDTEVILCKDTEVDRCTFNFCML